MLLSRYISKIDDDLVLYPNVVSGDHLTSIIDSYTNGYCATEYSSDVLTLQGRKGVSVRRHDKRDYDGPYVSQTFQKRTRLATQLPRVTRATAQTALPALEVLPAWKEDEGENLEPESLAMLAVKDSVAEARNYDFQIIDVPGIKPSGVYAGCYPAGTLDARTGLITTDGSSIVLIRAGWNGKEWTHTQETIQQGMIPALLTAQDSYDAYSLEDRDGSSIFAVAEDGTTYRIDRDRNGKWTPVGIGKIDSLASPTGSCGVSNGALDNAIDEAWGPLIWSGSAVYTSMDGKTLEDWTSAFEPFTKEEEANGN